MSPMDACPDAVISYVYEIKLPHLWTAGSEPSTIGSADRERVQMAAERELSEELESLCSVSLLELAKTAVSAPSGAIATLHLRFPNGSTSRDATQKQITNSINDGLIGNLRVDPSYLIQRSNAGKLSGLFIRRELGLLSVNPSFKK